MPNWCFNYVTIDFPHPKIMQSFIDKFYSVPPQYPRQDGADVKEYKKYMATKLYRMNGLVPVPKEVVERGYDDGTSSFSNLQKPENELNGYDWQTRCWGTKWDFNLKSYDVDIDYERWNITFAVDTAWSPPLEFFKRLTALFPDIKIHLNFIEETEGYMGTLDYDPITNQLKTVEANEGEKEFFDLIVSGELEPYKYTENFVTEAEQEYEGGMDEMLDKDGIFECSACGNVISLQMLKVYNGICPFCHKHALIPCVSRVEVKKGDK